MQFMVIAKPVILYCIYYYSIYALVGKPKTKYPDH